MLEQPSRYSLGGDAGNNLSGDYNIAESASILISNPA